MPRCSAAARIYPIAPDSCRDICGLRGHQVHNEAIDDDDHDGETVDEEEFARRRLRKKQVTQITRLTRKIGGSERRSEIKAVEIEQHLSDNAKKELELEQLETEYVDLEETKRIHLDDQAA